MFLHFQNLLRDAFQVGVLTFAFYYLYLFVRTSTRMRQLLIGIGSLLILSVCVRLFSLSELDLILSMFAPSLLVILCIMFQPELRRLLAGIVGERHAHSSPETAIETVVRAVDTLSHQRIGALIAFERLESLRPYEQHGRLLDAPLIADLLVSIFYPHAPMHDGAVILRKGRIAAAGCVFPVAMGQGSRRSYGTRHRAAIGLTEETDAVVVIVSEETGLVSIAFHGELERGLDQEGLRNRLSTDLNSQDPPRSGLRSDPAEAEDRP